LSNGSTLILSGKGRFSMLRPLPTFYAQIREQVRVDTNWFFSNDRQQRHDGTNLHFGIASSVTNEGIAFVYSNALTSPAALETYGKYALAQIIEVWRQQYNLRDGTSCTGYQAGGEHGLDGKYPSLGDASETIDYVGGRWADSPGASLTIATWLTYTNSFKTFLMFQPKPYTNSIAVPMYQVDWNWAGTATNGPWGKLSGSASCGSPAMTEAFPYWTHTITNVDTTSASPTNCYDEN
jgi:hypothetical protein